LAVQAKIEASPAALLAESRTPQKKFPFPFACSPKPWRRRGRKNGLAHIRKSEENFFVGWRASARGGTASIG